MQSSIATNKNVVQPHAILHDRKRYLCTKIAFAIGRAIKVVVVSIALIVGGFLMSEGPTILSFYLWGNDTESYGMGLMSSESVLNNFFSSLFLGTAIATIVIAASVVKRSTCGPTLTCADMPVVASVFTLAPLCTFLVSTTFLVVIAPASKFVAQIFAKDTLSFFVWLIVSFCSEILLLYFLGQWMQHVFFQNCNRLFEGPSPPPSHDTNIVERPQSIISQNVIQPAHMVVSDV